MYLLEKQFSETEEEDAANLAVCVVIIPWAVGIFCSILYIILEIHILSL